MYIIQSYMYFNVLLMPIPLNYELKESPKLHYAALINPSVKKLMVQCDYNYDDYAILFHRYLSVTHN